MRNNRPSTFSRRVAAGMLAAAGIAAALGGAAAPAHAAVPSAPADLDVTSCRVFDDPVNYGDGIDWYYLQYTFTNEGGLPTPYGWNSRTNFVWTGTGHNEESVNTTEGVLQPGQTVTRTYWLTKRIVDNHTWGIFLDTGNIVPQGGQTADDHCNFYVNNT
jgi:hypothetical protein